MAAKDISDVLAPVAMIGEGIAGGMGAGAAYSKSVADRNAYTMQAEASGNNALIAEAQRSDAMRRGEVAVVNSGLKTNQLKGQQIAALAASGIDLGSGSAQNILTSTDLLGANDANIIAMNAAKEAWGFGVQAQNERSKADLLRYRAGMESPVRAGVTSLLTSAGTVADKWYRRRHPYPGVE